MSQHGMQMPELSAFRGETAAGAYASRIGNDNGKDSEEEAGVRLSPPHSFGRTEEDAEASSVDSQAGSESRRDASASEEPGRTAERLKNSDTERTRCVNAKRVAEIDTPIKQDLPARLNPVAPIQIHLRMSDVTTPNLLGRTTTGDHAATAFSRGPRGYSGVHAHAVQVPGVSEPVQEDAAGHRPTVRTASGACRRGGLVPAEGREATGEASLGQSGRISSQSGSDRGEGSEGDGHSPLGGSDGDDTPTRRRASAVIELLYSKSTNQGRDAASFRAMLAEWELVSVDDLGVNWRLREAGPSSRCACGANPIRYEYHIANKTTMAEMLLGSVCVKLLARDVSECDLQTHGRFIRDAEEVTLVLFSSEGRAEKLKSTVLVFGRHQGLTFGEAFTQQPGWSDWMVRNAAASSNKQAAAFIRFAKAMKFVKRPDGDSPVAVPSPIGAPIKKCTVCKVADVRDPWTRCYACNATALTGACAGCKKPCNPKYQTCWTCKST